MLLEVPEADAQMEEARNRKGGKFQAKHRLTPDNIPGTYAAIHDSLQSQAFPVPNQLNPGCALEPHVLEHATGVGR